MKAPTLYCDDGSEITLPTKWEICSVCEGCATDRGANVECDGGGFTSEEWAEQDDDFREGYLRGDYDRPCAACDGKGRVQVPDFHRMDAAGCQEWLEQEREEFDYQRICMMERRMGA